jgi:predicted transcriptional regulator
MHNHKNGGEMVDRSLAKAFKRKIGLDEDILTKIEVKRGESSLLMNSSRRKVFTHICNHPCCHLRAISRATGYSTQTVRWHLKKLVEGGLISESSGGGKKLYRPLKNIIMDDECKVLEILNRTEPREVYLFIEKWPKSTQNEICKALGTYQQLLSRALLLLERSGLITHKKIGRKKAYFITGKLKELEEAFKLKSITFQNAIIDALKADSLNPSIESSDENILQIKLDFGGGEGPFLKLNKNPLKAITGNI